MSSKLSNIIYSCLTVFFVVSSIPVFAGGCIYQNNKQTNIECSKNDVECQLNKDKKNESYKKVSS